MVSLAVRGRPLDQGPIPAARVAGRGRIRDRIAMFPIFPSRRAGSVLLSTTPNRWDWALLPLVLLVLSALAFGAVQMNRPFVVGQATPISLDPLQLPYYLLRTV